MTVHLIPVGISLLQRMREDKDRFGIRSSQSRRMLDVARVGSVPQTRDDAAATWLGQRLAPTGAPSPELLGLVETLDPLAWPAEVSAELQTYTCPGPVLPPTAGQRPVHDGDRVVLIASATAQGLTAALWNAVALTGDLARVSFLPNADHAFTSGGTATILQVPGMDAGNPQGFRDAMRTLGEFGGGALVPLLDEGADLRVHLSGGFKATIPYLIALAEALRSCSPRITAHVVHESAVETGAPARGIAIPLRRIGMDVLRDELDCFTAAGHCGYDPGRLILLGYAYDGDPGRGYDLTPFGEGLLALIQAVPPPVGG